MTSPVRAGRYRVVTQIVTPSEPFEMPEGAEMASIFPDSAGRLHIVFLERVLPLLTEGGRRRGPPTRPPESDNPNRTF